MKRTILPLLFLLPVCGVSACSDDDDGGGGSAGSSSAGNAGSPGSAANGGNGGNGGNGQSGDTDMLGGAAGDGGAANSRQFTLTLENVGQAKAFVSGGVFDTPVGADAPGPITPGKKYEFTINAGRKHKLSFVTMLAATNDLFFAQSGGGIALYDGDGKPIC